MLTDKEANQLFRDLISKESNELGFITVENGLSATDPPYLMRQLENQKEIIGSLYLTKFDNKCRAVLYFNKRFDQIENIWGKFYPMIFKVSERFDPINLTTIATNLKSLEEYNSLKDKRRWLSLNDRFEAECKEDEIVKLSQTYMDRINNKIIPFFDSYNTVLDVNNKMNEKPEAYWEYINVFSAVGLYYKKVITAHLTSDVRFNEICDFSGQKLSDLKTFDNLPQIDIFKKLLDELN